MKCENYIIVSWYQKPCIREAKYRVTRKHEYLNGTSSISIQNLCAICSRREREYRYKLDNHIFYNDASLDHTYPIIEAVKGV